MIHKIKNSLSDPALLEQLYREDKSAFVKAFDALYPEIQGDPLAAFWNQRLHYANNEITWGSKNELIIVLALAFLAGLIAKSYYFIGIDFETFFPRNVSFVVFPALAIYFMWKTGLSKNKIILVGSVFIIAAVYVNLLPWGEERDTINLVLIHLPLLLWSLTAFVFTSGKIDDLKSRIEYLRYNGDLVIMGTLMGISGLILSGVTVGLFGLINLQIEEFYFEHIAMWGAAAIPMVATFLVRSNPQLVKNVSPIIAKVFTPLVLIMLVVYIVAMVITGKDPYNDREFLLIFNVLLLGVMAIILFSVVENTRSKTNNFSTWMLFLLSVVTIVINGIALSAIVFRISEWGITPNRMAVLGSNLLILTHLVMVSFQLFKSLKDRREFEMVELRIAGFLPIYAAWTAIVVFVFPVIFGWK